MYRRIISSCVLAGFLIAQWAAIPHAHAEGNPLDHSAAPHVHLAAAGGSSHAHSHDHKPCAGHDHCHATPAAAHENALDDCGVSGMANHDADAVYLPAPVSITATSGVGCSKIFATPVISHAFGSSFFIDTPTDKLVAAPRPSHDYAPSCALYLALRTLRI